MEENILLKDEEFQRKLNCYLEHFSPSHSYLIHFGPPELIAERVSPTEAIFSKNIWNNGNDSNSNEPNKLIKDEKLLLEKMKLSPDCSFDENVVLKQKKEASNSTLQNKSSNDDHTLEVLRAVVKPRIFEFEDKIFVQNLSQNKSKRKDVFVLEGRLIAMIMATIGGRYINILNPERQKLIDCFCCELLRQLTLESPLTGQLLIRVRDDYRQNINCLRHLILFSNRKDVQELSQLKETRIFLDKLILQKNGLMSKISQMKISMRYVFRERHNLKKIKMNYYRMAKAQLIAANSQLKNIISGYNAGLGWSVGLQKAKMRKKKAYKPEYEE